MIKDDCINAVLKRIADKLEAGKVLEKASPLW